ncbi:MAG: hypothetical protein AAF533_02570 [Acidobacteriota bacterium]
MARILPLVALLLTTSLATDAWAINKKAKKAYDTGLDALNGGDPVTARDQFQTALSLDGKEGRFRKGATFIEYFPSLRLAQALVELKDWDAAKTALDRADGTKLTSDLRGTAGGLRVLINQGRSAAASGGGSSGGGAPPPPPSGPDPEAERAQSALDRGDLAGARRMAMSVLSRKPSESLASRVLAAVDQQLSNKLQQARGEKSGAQLARAEGLLQEVLAVDPNSSAARSLLSAVQDDQRAAQRALTDARSAMDRKRFDEADRLARRARDLDAGLRDRVRSLQGEIESARRRASQVVSNDPPPRRDPDPPPVTSGPSKAERAASLLRQAQSHLKKGSLAKARQAAEDAALADGSQSTAVNALKETIASQGQRASKALSSARSASLEGRFGEAKARAEEARKLDGGLGTEVRSLLDDQRERETEVSGKIAAINVLIDNGASKQAATQVDQLAKKFPGHPDLAELRLKVSGSNALVAGLRAYFEGDFSGSISALQGQADSHGADVLAVLASAHATRGLLRGDDADLSRAREVWGLALAKKADLKLDPRFFSPRVQDVFRGVEPAS